MDKTSTLAEAFDEICAMDGPLNERLAAYGNRLREINFPFAEAYDDLVARLREGRIGAAAPNPGDVMPSFLLPSQDGRLFRLEDFLGPGLLVLTFNRGHWCPFCKIEIRTLVEHHEAIREAGGQFVSIMPDTQRFTRPLAAQFAPRLIILSDVDNGYALSLGLVMALGDKVRGLMRDKGFHLEEFQANDGFLVPLPATYIIGRDGRVVDRHVDPDFRTRMDPDDILAALRRAHAG